jgi:hypothetical protein
MPQDNTLGAPTEGLGQTVTFAANQSGLPQQSGLDYGQIRTSVQGGTVNPGATRAQNIEAAGQSPIMAMVMKYADNKTKEKMKEDQTNAFLSGMQKAAAGEAVVDIAKEQPWYSQLFGESDVVEGARSYSASAAGQSIAADLEEQIPALAAMPPEEAQKHFRDAVQSVMTGDTATDAQIMMSVTRTMPSVMKRHAKEHYGYLQQQAVVQQQTAWRAGARRVEAAARNMAREMAMGPADTADFDTLLGDMKASLQHAPGQNLEKWQDSLKTFMTEQASAGNFHLVNALTRETAEEPNMLQALTSQQRQQVEAAMESGETKQRLKYSYEWGDRLAALEVQAALPQEGETAADTARRVDALNEEYRLATGSKQGIILPGQRAALTSGSASAIIREKQRQAAELQRRAERAEDLRRAAADKAETRIAAQQAKQQLEAAGLVAFATGGAGIFANSPGVNRRDYDASVYRAWQAQGTPDGLLSAVQVKTVADNQRSDYVNPTIQNVLIGQVKDQLGRGEITQQWRGTVENYRRISEASPAAARAHYGEYAVKMEGYLQAVGSNVPEAVAFKDHLLSARRPGKIDPKDMKAAAQAVGNNDWSMKLGITNNVRLKPGQDATIAKYLDGPAGEWVAQGKESTEAYKIAFEARKGTSMELVGGYALSIDKGQKPIEQLLTHIAGPKGERPVATDNVHMVFEDAVNGALFGNTNEVHTADDMDAVHVIRLPDAGNYPQFQLSGIKEGKVFNQHLDGRDILTMAEKGNKLRKRAPLARVGMHAIDPVKQPDNTSGQGWLDVLMGQATIK